MKKALVILVISVLYSLVIIAALLRIRVFLETARFKSQCQECRERNYMAVGNKEAK